MISKIRVASKIQNILLNLRGLGIISGPSFLCCPTAFGRYLSQLAEYSKAFFDALQRWPPLRGSVDRISQLLLLDLGLDLGVPVRGLGSLSNSMELFQAPFLGLPLLGFCVSFKKCAGIIQIPMGCFKEPGRRPSLIHLRRVMGDMPRVW